MKHKNKDRSKKAIFYDEYGYKKGPLEIMEIIESEYERQGTYRKTARVLGITPPTVSRYLSMRGFTDDELEFISANGMNQSVILAIRSVYDDKPNLGRLMKDIPMLKLNGKQAVDHAKALKDGNRPLMQTGTIIRKYARNQIDVTSYLGTFDPEQAKRLLEKFEKEVRIAKQIIAILRERLGPPQRP